jgi:hypothetical protein
MDDEPDSTFFPGEEELRARTRSRVHIGIIIMFSPVFLFSLILIIGSTIPGWASLPILAFLIVGPLLGGIVFIFYGSGSKLFFHSLDLIKKISPDEIVLKNRYAVVKKGLVHLVATWGSNTLFFIVFLHSMPSEKLKLKIPRVIWRWEYKVSVGEVKVARREGQYKVPISEENFITGEGILYSLLIESMPPVRKLQHPSSDQLLQIASNLVDEAAGIGSGMIR